MCVRREISSRSKLANSLGNGAPAATRTRDPRLTRPVRYPTELRAAVCSYSMASKDDRAEWTEVPILEAPGRTAVGRFGWAAQHASLLSFSADTYRNAT